MNCSVLSRGEENAFYSSDPPLHNPVVDCSWHPHVQSRSMGLLMSGTVHCSGPLDRVGGWGRSHRDRSCAGRILCEYSPTARGNFFCPKLCYKQTSLRPGKCWLFFAILSSRKKSLNSWNIWLSLLENVWKYCNVLNKASLMTSGFP